MQRMGGFFYGTALPAFLPVFLAGAVQRLTLFVGDPSALMVI